MDLPPIPEPEKDNKTPVVKGIRDFRSNLSRYIELTDKKGVIIIETYGQDRKLKAKYELRKLKI